ncbi:MAG: DUF5666 domain-containing protein [Gammaproteobacteria bacterium]|jgi:hypothetical protein
MTYRKMTAALILAATLSACGGGSGGSADDPGSSGGPAAANAIDTIGRIDAFGSIFVNGIEFETRGASYRVDDEDSFDDSSLSVGMIVRVKGTRSDEKHGIAHEIYFDDEIEGLVADLTIDSSDDTVKRFTIFGTAIVASSATTVFRGDNGMPYSFDALAAGDHVEVSGDLDGDAILASFIRLKDNSDDDFEVKGTVSGFDGTSFVLTMRNGNTLEVTLAAGAGIPAAGIVDGQFVEVEGTIPDPEGAPTGLTASRVELEHHHDFEDDDDHERDGHEDEDDDDDRHDGSGSDRHDGYIEGVLNLDGDAWTVRTTTLQFDDATEYRPASLEAAIADGSASGQRAKVRGNVVNGVMAVERIELEYGDNLEVRGIVDGVATDDATGDTTITISFTPAEGTVTAIANSQTLLKNDDARVGFELGDLVAGSFVEIHGHPDTGGNFVACVLEVEDGSSKYEVEGPLDTDGYVEGSSISVMGVVFMLDADTLLKDGSPMNGDIVEVEDRDRDGFADTVEIGD